MGDPEPMSSRPGRLRRLLGWIRAHKLRTALILIGAFLLAELATIPWFSVARLAKENPERTALMDQRVREAESEGKKYRVTQRWIPISRIPRHVVNAVIVAEDGTFWTHGGFDWFEVQASLEKNIKKGKAVRGGSTITQQLAKNLYLSTSKDPLRKAKEALITLLLENALSKSRILELYLNCIEWGRGIFGIEAASQAYFGKSASALTLEEGARLAAVIPSPLRHRPNTDTRYVRFRTAIVMNRLSGRGMIPQSQPEEESSSQTEPEGTDIDETDSTATDGGSLHGL
jgi:monofunctional biosynthetic peptidoglycan transglycosylase